MPLDMELGLGPDHIALDEDSVPPPSSTQPPPIFDRCVLWPNGWRDQEATWYGGRPRPRLQCVRWGPCFPHKGGHSSPPTFRPMSIVAKRLDGSGYHLVRRQASAQATLCYMETQLPLLFTAAPTLFGPRFSGTVAHLSCCWALVVFVCFVLTLRGTLEEL